MTKYVPRCIYCDARISHETLVPAPADDKAWEELASEHAKGCEWIVTRAHWLPINQQQ